MTYNNFRIVTFQKHLPQSASLSVLFVYNQERRSNRIILPDIAISEQYKFPTITYIINYISISVSYRATTVFCTYQCTHRSSDPLQAHRPPRHTPAEAFIF